MASHTVAEAKNHLSELIEKAIGGEEVVITRHGMPVAMIKPVVRQPGPSRTRRSRGCARIG
jgi:prevent-host-death family protein